MWKFFKAKQEYNIGKYDFDKMNRYGFNYRCINDVKKDGIIIFSENKIYELDMCRNFRRVLVDNFGVRHYITPEDDSFESELDKLVTKNFKVKL